jgi:HEPN domain-containing protein
LSERDPRAEGPFSSQGGARRDGDAAARALNQEISDEIVGFHAQQAVAKWLKAVLGSRGVEFEYTHDLHRLIAEVIAAVGKFPFDTAEVGALTEHAVPMRYDEILDTEPLDRQAVVHLVEEVGEWADARLRAKCAEPDRSVAHANDAAAPPLLTSLSASLSSSDVDRRRSSQPMTLCAGNLDSSRRG